MLGKTAAEKDARQKEKNDSKPALTQTGMRTLVPNYEKVILRQNQRIYK